MWSFCFSLTISWATRLCRLIQGSCVYLCELVCAGSRIQIARRAAFRCFAYWIEARVFVWVCVIVWVQCISIFQFNLSIFVFSTNKSSYDIPMCHSNFKLNHNRLSFQQTHINNSMPCSCDSFTIKFHILFRPKKPNKKQLQTLTEKRTNANVRTNNLHTRLLTLLNVFKQLVVE